MKPSKIIRNFLYEQNAARIWSAEIRPDVEAICYSVFGKQILVVEDIEGNVDTFAPINTKNTIDAEVEAIKEYISQ